MKKDFYTQNRTYPEVLLPNAFKGIKQMQPPFSIAPQKPTEPTKPDEPNKTRNNSNDIGCLFTIIGCLISGGIILLTFHISDSPIAIMLSFCSIFAALFLISIPIGYVSELKEKISFKNSYSTRITQYEEELNEYKTKKKQYDVQLLKYEEQCKNQEEEKKRLLLPQNIAKYQQHNFLELLRQTTPPQNIDTSYIQYVVTKGISELYFLGYLKKSYGDNILINTCLTSYKKAYPDFIYWDKSINMVIDIEIDEPYVGNSGEPIHYIIENEKTSKRDGKSIDDDRDNMINSANWILVKFAEQQVFQNPSGCIKYLDWVIEKLKNFDLNFSEQTFLTPITRWTKVEAFEMDYRQFRITYIPEDYYELLSAENDFSGNARIIKAQNEIFKRPIRTTPYMAQNIDNSRKICSNSQVLPTTHSQEMANSSVVLPNDLPSKKETAEILSKEILDKPIISINPSQPEEIMKILFNKPIDVINREEREIINRQAQKKKSLTGIQIGIGILWSVGIIALYLTIFVGIGCLLAKWLCDIDMNKTYSWYSGIWHGLFVIPNWVRSWFDVNVLCRAIYHSGAYSFWWWITFICTILGIISGSKR